MFCFRGIIEEIIWWHQKLVSPKYEDVSLEEVI